MTAILDGIRVLDFGRYIAGPFCAALLADLGAEVIRVERPGGGEDRFLMPALPSGEGAMFLQCNRSKKAITLDPATPEGREVMRRLIARSDVVIANVSPGALRHFGLDYASLCAIREDIILTTVSAFGSTGRMSEALGFDGVGQAVSGAVYLTGEPGQPYRSATSYVDYGTAMASAYGTLAAILRRMKTGEGSHVESSLVGTALTITNSILIEEATGANHREPTGNRSPIAGPSDVFRAADGWFIMQVIGGGMFRRWARIVGRPDLLDDQRFADDILRGRNGAELSAVMAEWAASRTRDECLVALAAANIAASPVLTPGDVIGGALGLADTFLERSEGNPSVPVARPPVHLSGIEPARRAAPAIGQDTDVVLRDAGYSADDIAGLRDRKVI